MKQAILSIVTAITLLSAPLAEACTIWGAQGKAVADGGSLIAKVRDFKPGPQEIRVNTKGKYAVYALYTGSDREHLWLNSGVNEKGLAVVPAMASCIPGKIRKAMTKKVSVRRILQNCATIEEALTHPDFFIGPRYLILADPYEVALVEIGDGGRTAITRSRNHYLAHTNYYLDSRFADLNIRMGKSAATRYSRINELLGQEGKPFTMEKFISFTDDRNDGPDNSIWRLGSKPGVSESLAAFVVQIAPDGNFRGWIKYRPEPQDKGKEKIVTFSREDILKAK